MMTTTEMERAVLLAHSGELAEAARDRLEKEITSDAETAAFRDDLEQICGMAREELASREPSAATMTNVLSDIRKRRARRTIIAFPAPVIRLAACAAALTLVVGSWMVWVPAQAPASSVAELRSIVAMVSSRDVDPDIQADRGETEQIRALARELLIMQGLAEDEDESSMSEEFLFEELQPTTLRWRSTPASSSRIYG